MDKLNQLKAYVEGMAVTSTGTTQKALQKILARIDVLETEEKTYFENLANSKKDK